MLKRIEKLLGKKVRWATEEEIEENVLGEKDSVTYISKDELSIDTVDQKEDSFQEMYYILLDGEYQGYIIVV